jgi:hypothetical protein
MRPSEQRQLASIRAELSRLIRYDDESIVHDTWARQRYDCGCFPGLMAARGATVAAAWHEAGHALAALGVGAHFSSASIHHGCTAEGRVHGISGAGDLAFVIDAAGQIAERLMRWTMLERDDDLRAWRYSEQRLVPLRLRIARVARALLVHPRYLPYNVVLAIAAHDPAQRRGP